MGQVLGCNKSTITIESNVDVPQPMNDNLPEIKFDRVIREISECDISANQCRIEKYELKGFNSMTPKIKQIKNEEKVNKMSSMFNEEKLDVEMIDYLGKDEFKEISELKFGRMKHEKCSFDSVDIDSITLGKYGNPNIVNCIYFLNSKRNKYFETMFTKFDIKNGEYQVKCYINGKLKKYLFDNKVIKKTPFIHTNENNFWIYFIEKAIAKRYKHYIYTIPLAGSEIFKCLSCAPLEVLPHSVVQKKDLYEKIKTYLKKNKTFIIFAEQDLVSSTNPNVKENNFSVFVSSVFKVNGHKYVEMFLPKTPNDARFASVIIEEDKGNTKYFSKEKTSDRKYVFYKLDSYFKTFRTTYVLQYEPNFLFNQQRIILSDQNVNLIKLKVDKKTKMSLSFNLKHPFLFRFVLAKLIITENYIRRIRTMSSKDINDDTNSYYTDEIDYNFEYIDSLYQYDIVGTIEKELDEGIYSLLFNVYTNNETVVTITTYSNNEIEFMDNSEKISEQKLNSQIKTLFHSYMKSNRSSIVKKKVHESCDIVSYESLINENFGYSIYMVENESDNQNTYVTLFCDTDGMNLITKDYINDTTSVQIVIPPKNFEIIVFEWEKPYNEIYIYVEASFSFTQIEPMFTESSFLNLPRKYLAKTNVYYIEIQYRRGVFLVFVNENVINDVLIQFSFETFSNLEYKGLKQAEIQGKQIDIDLPSRSYMSYNLKAIDIEMDVSYKISLKILKNKAATSKDKI